MKIQAREAGKPINHDRQLAIIRYSPCGKYLVAGDFMGQVQRWDASGTALVPLTPLPGHHGWVQALAFHADGKRLFSGDSWGRLCCWSFTEKTVKPTWSVAQAHDGWIRQLAVSPDGKVLASCGADGRVRLWSPDKGEKSQDQVHGVDVLSLAFAPDSKSVVFGDLKGQIERRESATGKKVQSYDAKGMHSLDRIQDVGGVRCLAFDPAGTILAAGGSQSPTGGFVQGTALMMFFESGSGKVKQALKFGTANEGYVLDLHWHKDGFVMAVTSGQPGQGKLLFQRPGDAQPFFTTAKMANCHSLAVHPDGKRLLVSATNAGSSGNGRRLTKNKEYPGNTSPLYPWELNPG